MPLKDRPVIRMLNAMQGRVPSGLYLYFIRMHNKYLLRAQSAYVDKKDRKTIRSKGLRFIPPAYLRYRVHGDLNLHTYIQVGLRSFDNIVNCLEKAGLKWTDINDVLDFGCGCGRVVRILEDQGKSIRICGVDIDMEAISWCQKNIPFARFNSNLADPPLSFKEDSFDLVFAFSVFTHLGEQRQFEWLTELKRITRPDGIVLISLHGNNYHDRMGPQQKRELKRNGFVFSDHISTYGILPDWYQSAFHTKDYVIDRYQRFFDIVDYVPSGLNDFQDMVILRKK